MHIQAGECWTGLDNIVFLAGLDYLTQRSVTIKPEEKEKGGGGGIVEAE